MEDISKNFPLINNQIESLVDIYINKYISISSLILRGKVKVGWPERGHFLQFRAFFEKNGALVNYLSQCNKLSGRDNFSTRMGGKRNPYSIKLAITINL